MYSSEVRAQLVIAPLVALLVLFLWIVLETGATRAVDFAAYYSAARIIRHGGDPYNHDALLQEERRVCGPVLREGQRLCGAVANPDLVRVAEPPLLFWTLQPVTVLPLGIASRLAEILLALCSATGLAGVARALAWRRWAVPVMFGLAMPQTVIIVLNGNVMPIVFAALGLALWVRRFPLVAGVLLSLTWIKPQVALPLAGLIVLFHTPSRWRATAGFALGSLAGIFLVALTTGPQSISWWIEGMRHFSGTIPAQGDIPSLSGLYVRWAPPDLRLALTVASACLAAALTMLTLQRRWNERQSTPVLSLGWLWVVWFLAIPYCHLSDELFLAPPILALYCVARARTVFLLYGAALSMLAMTWYPAGVSPLPLLPLAALTLVSWRSDGESARGLRLEAPYPVSTG